MTKQAITEQRQQDIKKIAERIDRIKKDAKRETLPEMFWEDLDALINLILEDKKENE